MRQINRERPVKGWRWLTAVVLAVLAVLAALAAPCLARQKHSPEIRRVLHANRIGPVGFGTHSAVVVRQVNLLLRHRPIVRLHVGHGCGIDRAVGWPGLVVFFRGHRFVGYSYRPAYGMGRVPILATARGLRVGDTLRLGRILYGAAFHSSKHHGGTWWARTPEGRVHGLASGWPGGPRGSVATIAAGHVGCSTPPSP